MEQRVAKRVAWLDRLEIGLLDGTEIEEVLDVLARGMRDNPLHVAAFGEDPERRRQRLRSLMAAAFSARDFSHTLLARREDGGVVGVCGTTTPGYCPPGLRHRLLPTLLPIGSSAAGCAARRMSAREEYDDDPEGRHWHLGPLAVDAHLQGMGVGSRLMRVFCARMDAAGDDAYLQTDKPINVSFYEAFGFEVVGEEEALGVSTYLMLRRAKGRRRGGSRKVTAVDRRKERSR